MHAVHAALVSSVPAGEASFAPISIYDIHPRFDFLTVYNTPVIRQRLDQPIRAVHVKIYIRGFLRTVPDMHVAAGKVLKAMVVDREESPPDTFGKPLPQAAAGWVLGPGSGLLETCIPLLR